MSNHVIVDAFYLPNSIKLKNFQEKPISVNGVNYLLRYPVIQRQELQEIAAAVKENRRTYLATLPTSEIVVKIDKAIQLWMNPDYPLRQLAESLVPAITGYDSDMVRLELKKYMRTFRKRELLRFLDEEFDQPAILDEFRPRKSGGMSRAFGPSTIFHVFSGNVPGVQIWSLVMGLLLKSAAIGKTSLSEPLLPVLFLQSLKEVDEALAESMAVIPWKGGTVELEQAAVDWGDAVIVYGSNHTVEAIKTRTPVHKKLLSYGHKISMALIGKEALTADHFAKTLHKVAEDVSIYDQQSCLSPQVIYVEKEGALSPKQFAQGLAGELGKYHLKRPRARLTGEEAMAIQNIRNQYHLKSLSSDKVAVYSSKEDTAWTVIYQEEPAFSGTPLNRTVHVYAIDKLEAAADLLKSYETYLQSCGLAVEPARLFSITSLLGAVGVNRFCPIGEMNSAKPGWHHDGGFNLIELVRMVDMERTLEYEMEKYDEDVE
ncbi:acyl-CoA reductase [Niallia taxi]|uniref:acyl-CoA reductase n=1 Tax=Niallia taxi TaxID=2499688 RepID=UPI002E1BF0F1|nr:acyl-CoA reductase [Niallia taxi]MED4056872.1 acyl-CoA reductase [Niallia taxi]MED4121756.1 acyl-CoA reductase [Niallia taxi]